MILSLRCPDSGVAICRATNSGCSRAKSRPAGFCRLTPRSRYRIEMVQVREWTESGLTCGALPADCAPVECERFWQLKRHSTETERHMGRSLQSPIFKKCYLQKVSRRLIPKKYQEDLFPKKFYPCKAEIRRERPACRSAPVKM